MYAILVNGLTNFGGSLSSRLWEDTDVLGRSNRKSDTSGANMIALNGKFWRSLTFTWVCFELSLSKSLNTKVSVLLSRNLTS